MIGKRIHKILFTKKWNGYKEKSEEQSILTLSSLPPPNPFPFNNAFLSYEF